MRWQKLSPFLSNDIKEGNRNGNKGRKLTIIIKKKTKTEVWEKVEKKKRKKILIYKSENVHNYIYFI